MLSESVRCQAKVHFVAPFTSAADPTPTTLVVAMR
jgi:hypothetical protein